MGLGVPWGFGGQIFSPEIQPDLVCELYTRMAHALAQFSGSPPPGALGKGSKFKFFNMVMWHIKLKEMSSRPGYTEKVKPMIKLETLGWGQRVNYHLISSTLLKKSNGLLTAYRTWWYWAVYSSVSPSQF